MDEIAAEAGTAKPVLYRYFGDKGGLYQALAERYVQLVMATVEEALGDRAADSPRERLEAGIDAYLGLVEEQSEIYRFLMHRAVTGASRGPHDRCGLHPRAGRPPRRGSG